VGAPDSKKPPTDNVERFLSMLRFDSKGKFVDLEIEGDYLTAFKMK